MKATIEFVFPEDQHEYDIMLESSRMYLALHDMKRDLRHEWKHGDLSQEQWDMVDKIRERFFEILQENNVNLDL